MSSSPSITFAWCAHPSAAWHGVSRPSGSALSMYSWPLASVSATAEDLDHRVNMPHAVQGRRTDSGAEPARRIRFRPFETAEARCQPYDQACAVPMANTDVTSMLNRCAACREGYATAC